MIPLPQRREKCISLRIHISPEKKMLGEIMLGEKGLKRPVTVSTLGKLGAQSKMHGFML